MKVSNKNLRYEEGEMLPSETWNSLPREAVYASIPGSVQGQVGWHFGQPELVGDVAANSRGFKSYFQTKPFSSSY